MKMMVMFLFIMAMVLGFYVQAHATLTTIGQAQFGGAGPSYNLIWDNDSPFGSIVWLDYTKGYVNWGNQVAWANGLNTADTLSYNINPLYSVTWSGDWRLPVTVDGEWVWGYDGTTTAGYNITTCELGHLYYTELGNKGYYATDGTNPQPGWGLANTGPFTNLQAVSYWSGTEYSLDATLAWYFGFTGGGQGYFYKDGDVPALAVRPGNVVSAPVPEPATMLLLGSGLIGLLGYGRKKFLKK